MQKKVKFVMYLNYHLTTIVNFDNFTFCGTILSNDVIETLNWFYFFQMLCAISKLSFVIITLLV